MKNQRKIKLAPEGRKLIITVAFVALGLAAGGFLINSALLINLFRLLALFLLFCLNFFRDPDRKDPEGEDLVVSPADGKIIKIETVNDPDIGENATLVSIFLNVFNVHRNRVPFSGRVIDRSYRKGKFRAAFDHKASNENEQTIIILETVAGKIKIKQIAGLLARRILCYATVGSEMTRGDNLGFIRFGSRTDLILPEGVRILARVGQKVHGSVTVLGKFSMETSYEKKE